MGTVPRRQSATRCAGRRRCEAAAKACVRSRFSEPSRLRSGPLEDELRALAGDGVQSLLLEGGPTLATAFFRAGLIDKLLLFVAPILSGSGPRFLGELEEPVELSHVTATPSGEDVLIEAYVHVP